ncbi:MAG: DUF2993 domain-containing protein [Candidatus Cloacimonetes bacterium]|nr:DUF2993 domain-containing protein [Candidatus Cloacimonadota bacterium]
MRKLQTLLLLSLYCHAHALNSTAFSEAMTNPELVIERIHSAITTYIQTSTELDIDITMGSRAELIRGQVSRVHIRTQRAMVKNVMIDFGEFILHDPRIDMDQLYEHHKLRVLSMGKSDFKIRILEEDMNSSIRKKRLQIQEPQIRFLDDQLYFRARFQTLFIKSLVETQGQFEIRDQNQIYFVPNRIKLNRIPLPGFVKRSLTDKINPILDLRTFDLIDDIKEIRLKSGVVEIEG